MLTFIIISACVLLRTFRVSEKQFPELVFPCGEKEANGALKLGGEERVLAVRG